jgi:hypothetical protein
MNTNGSFVRGRAPEAQAAEFLMHLEQLKLRWLKVYLRRGVDADDLSGVAAAFTESRQGQKSAAAIGCEALRPDDRQGVQRGGHIDVGDVLVLGRQRYQQRCMTAELRLDVPAGDIAPQCRCAAVGDRGIDQENDADRVSVGLQKVPKFRQSRRRCVRSERCKRALPVAARTHGKAFRQQIDDGGEIGFDDLARAHAGADVGRHCEWHKVRHSQESLAGEPPQFQ